MKTTPWRAWPLALALLAQPAAADWLDDQGKVCVEHPDFQRRVDACTWLVNAQDGDATVVAAAYYFRAIAHAGLDRHEAALSDVSEALARHAGNPAYHFFRAYAHANLGRHRDAVADIDEALRHGFDRPAEAWGFRGELHMDLGEHEQAVMDAERSLAHAPGLHAAHALRDTALQHLHAQRCLEYEAAVTTAREAQAAARHDVAQRQLEIALGTHERAARFAAEHAPGAAPLGCDSPRWIVLAALGEVRLARGLQDEAVAAYRLALAAEDSAAANHAVARSLTAVDPLPAPLAALALTAAHRALALERRHEHLHTLAAAQAASGDYAAAAESERAALALLGEAGGEAATGYRQQLQRYVAGASRAAAAPPTPDEEATAAVAPAGTASRGGLYGEPWVLAQPGSNYTVQLFAGLDSEGVRAQLAGYRLTGDTATFALSRDGQIWYAAVHGSFASREQAVTAAQRLAARLDRSPGWVRRFAEVQAAIRAR